MPTRSSRTRARVAWLLGLWVVLLLGPLGLGGRIAHHHATGEPDRDCLVCLLLNSVLTAPEAVAPVSGPGLSGALTPPSPVSVTVAPTHSPAAPRAPPTSAGC